MAENYHGFLLFYSDEPGRRCLVVESRKRAEDGGFSPFQIKMIVRNSVEGLLPVQAEGLEGRERLYYQLDGWIPLVQYLGRAQGIPADELFRRIVRTIVMARRYLLDDAGFLLDERLIFVNPAYGTVGMAYLPAILPVDPVFKLKRLFSERFQTYQPQRLFGGYDQLVEQAAGLEDMLDEPTELRDQQECLQIGEPTGISDGFSNSARMVEPDKPRRVLGLKGIRWLLGLSALLAGVSFSIWGLGSGLHGMKSIWPAVCRSGLAILHGVVRV
ncbi:MAG: DUF6382 domain-containing protein [Solirubrobacterales bacterium]